MKRYNSANSEPITQEFIDNKMNELDEVYNKIKFLECTCESGSRVISSSIANLQSVLEKINALSTDY